MILLWFFFRSSKISVECSLYSRALLVLSYLNRVSNPEFKYRTDSNGQCLAKLFVNHQMNFIFLVISKGQKISEGTCCFFNSTYSQKNLIDMRGISLWYLDQILSADVLKELKVFWRWKLTSIRLVKLISIHPNPVLEF